MPKKLPILIIDSRERQPLDISDDPDFEGSITQKLDAGDYSLVGLESIVAIERKANCDELWMNLSSKKGRERLKREMERFKKIKYRFIIIEQGYDEFVDPTSYYVNKSRRNKFSPYMPVSVIMRELIDYMISFDVHVIFAGTKARSLIKKILLQVYRNHDTDTEISS